MALKTEFPEVEKVVELKMTTSVPLLFPKANKERVKKMNRRLFFIFSSEEY